MGPLGAGGSHVSTAGDVIFTLNGGVVAPSTALQIIMTSMSMSLAYLYLLSQWYQ